MGTLASELGPHVEELTQRPRVYADANLPAGIIAHMRGRLRWDVLAVVEHDELRRASDAEHYRMARQLRRTLISLDDDFLEEKHFPLGQSPGVIVLSAPDERGLVRLLKKIDRVYFLRRSRRERRSRPVPLLGKKIQIHPDWCHSDVAAKPPRRRRARSN